MTSILSLTHLSGVEQLRHILEHVVRVPIADAVGFHMAEIDVGRVVFVGEPSEAMYNPLGSVQGGWMATILDAACGCAVHSMLQPGQAYTSLEIKTVFHRALLAGTQVRAEGRIVQIGRRAGFAEADLRGVDGKLYATATSTCLVMEVAK